MIALDFEILRNIKSSGLIKIPMARKPVRVATLINESEFVARGHKLTHHSSVFLEDRFHDWNWTDGFFIYCAHSVEVGGFADVVVVYALSPKEKS